MHNTVSLSRTEWRCICQIFLESNAQRSFGLIITMSFPLYVRLVDVILDHRLVLVARSAVGFAKLSVVNPGVPFRFLSSHLAFQSQAL